MNQRRRLISVSKAAHICGYDSLQGFGEFREKHKDFPKPIEGTRKYDEKSIDQFLDKLSNIKQESSTPDWDKILAERFARRGNVQNENPISR